MKGGTSAVALATLLSLLAAPAPPSLAQGIDLSADTREAGTCVPMAACGDLDASGSVSAADALRDLRVAVGLVMALKCPCSPGICSTAGICGDADGSGKVTAGDALRTLRSAVGQQVTVLCECSDGRDLASSLLQGATFFDGEFPELGDVEITSKTEGPLTVRGAWLGWVELFVDPEESTATVEAAIDDEDVTVLAKTPKLGWYLIDAGAGNEKAFLDAVLENDWAIDAAAVIPGLRSNLALDWNSGPQDSPCGHYHGSLVQSVANRRGGNFAMEPVSAFALVPQSLADLVVRKLEGVPAGQHQVINISIAQSPTGGDIPDLATDECGIVCTQKWVAFEQYVFLRHFYQAVETLVAEHPEVADRSVITLIAGNTGAPLDAALAGLKTSFPNAVKRIVIVGGTNSDGEVEPGQFNYVDENSGTNLVYARGEGVSMDSEESGPQTCDGTSFAGPEVASVLDAVWRREPTLPSDRIVRALRDALDYMGTSVLPAGPDGRTSDEFIDLVVAYAAGTPPTSTTTTTTTTTSTTATTSTTTTTQAGCWCCCVWNPQLVQWECQETPAQGTGLCSYFSPAECGHGFCTSD